MKILDWSARKFIAVRAALTFVLAALVVGVYAPPAFAQTVPAAATYKWTLPTTGCTQSVTPCDNKPLTGADALTGVEVYVSTSPIADNSTMAPTFTLAADTLTKSYTGSVPNGATVYARFKAVNANGKSAFSTQLSKVITVTTPPPGPVIPGVPTNVTVEFKIG
jgi:hypothetical protein